MSQPGIFMKCALALLPLVMLLAACDKVRNAARNLEKKAGDATGSAASSHVSHLSGEDFESFTAQQGKVVVIDFYADWCGPCRKLAPILDRVAAENPGLVLIGKVNVDQQRELAGQHKVHSIPDVRIFRNGIQVDRFVGAPSETQVRERIEAHTKGLSPTGPGAEGKTPAENPQPAIAPATKDWLPQGIERR
jgi:thioredoxin 1